MVLDPPGTKAEAEYDRGTLKIFAVSKAVNPIPFYYLEKREE
jgi:hypothetical protein